MLRERPGLHAIALSMCTDNQPATHGQRHQLSIHQLPRNLRLDVRLQQLMQIQIHIHKLNLPQICGYTIYVEL
jgi:hypothetical protein